MLRKFFREYLRHFHFQTSGNCRHQTFLFSTIRFFQTSDTLFSNLIYFQRSDVFIFKHQIFQNIWHFYFQTLDIFKQLTLYFQTSDIFRNLTFSFSTPDPPTSLSFPWLFNRVKADFADSSNLVKKSNLQSKRYFVIFEKEIVNQNFKMYFLDTFFQTWLLSWGQISIFWW